TITQQLARNLFPARIGTAITPERKVREWIAAFRIERLHNKREILEAYLNTAPFLYNAVGLEMAARTYFSKPAFQLTIEEGATLVGMLKGPAYYSPVRHPDRARERRDLVLGLMAEQGILTAAVADSLQALPLTLRFQRQPEHESAAPHFTAAVRRVVEEWAETYGYDVTRDGLVVWTTLEPGLQREAEAAVDRQVERLEAVAAVEWSSRGMPSLGSADAYVARAQRTDGFGYFWASHPEVFDAHARESRRYHDLRAEGISEDEALAVLRDDGDFGDSLRTSVARLEAGLVALDPRTGDVRAYVGSRDWNVDQYDHAGVARRQPGSTFKLFVYATALQSGYGPEDTVRDEAVAVDMGGGRVWRPTNSGSSGSGAEVSLNDALAYSRNTVTVRLANEVGIARVAVTARRMGIRSRLDVVPSLALGTSPVTLLEMAGAYGTVANGGRHAEPRLVTRITTADGRLLEEFRSHDTYAIPARDANTLAAMLRGAVERGTGRGLAAFGLRGQYAGKTGTTQLSADGWFIGLHPDLVAAAWVGFNDQRLRFRSSYWGQGGHNALLVVGDFLQRAALPPAAFAAPPEPLPPFEVPTNDSLDLSPYFSEFDYAPAEMDPYETGEPLPDIAPAYGEMGYDPTGGSGGRKPPLPEPTLDGTLAPPPRSDIGDAPPPAPPPVPQGDGPPPPPPPGSLPAGTGGIGGE
ncbi:MAG TPA: transglycosylase domain-containing protein, partial [Rhodothermales bacterium]|nr:transglycosylase domain-containing protein [Rhodothermales bacterium]